MVRLNFYSQLKVIYLWGGWGGGGMLVASAYVKGFLHK